jgi:hypothetical protein
MTLIGVEPVLEFVKTVLYTGRVKAAGGPRPLSAILIATPECGKTSVVTDAITGGKCKTAIALNDVTGRGLMDLCKHHPEVSHFIINDLVTVMSHRESVNRYTLSIINAVTEEGLTAAAWPGTVETFEHGHRGIIACCTPKLIKDRRQWWNYHGLASRMLPFYYDHTDLLTIQIKDAIDADDKPTAISRNGTRGIVPLRIPEKPVRVTIPSNLEYAIRKLADQRAAKLGDPKGYRRLKQYRLLARAHALSRGGSRANLSVADRDFEWLQRMDAFVSYTEARQL